MRRMITFLLLVAFCLSLACPAFAAVSSPGESGPTQTPSGDSPKTGDTIMMWVAIMVVALAALAVLWVIYRKKMC